MAQKKLTSAEKSKLTKLRAKKYKGLGLTKSEQAQHQKWDKQIAKQQKETARIKRIMKIDKALGDKEGYKKSSVKVQKEMKRLSKKPIKLNPKAAKSFRKASKMATKKVAKRSIGKAIAKKIPGVSVAYMAHDIIKGVSKSTCSKRGGKWVSGKCQGAKKSTRKITSPAARDLKSKR
jgi:hypothetical protein